MNGWPGAATQNIEKAKQQLAANEASRPQFGAFMMAAAG